MEKIMANSNNMTTNKSKKKWLELPKELLEIIGKHLDSRIDVFRFRSVSTLWRSIALSYLQSQPNFPLDLPPPFNYTGILSHFIICRLENQIRTTSCLVKVFESSSGKLEHANPLICHNISTKCSQVCKQNNDDTSFINLLDCRLVEITKGCSLKLKRKKSDSKTKVVSFDGKEVGIRKRLPMIKKTVLFGSHGVVVLFESRMLWYWRFRGEEWVRLGSERTHYDDVMGCNNRYYVIDNCGIIYWIDDTSMNLVQYAPPLCGLGQLKNLVESEGQFYVVDFYFRENYVAADEDLINNCGRFERVNIKVYRLDEEWGTWVDVKSLGDRVFVLGKDVSFSHSVKEFPGCPGNCIYFLDTRLDDRNLTNKLKPLVIRLFQFEDGGLRTIDCLPAYRKLFSPAKNWSLTTLPSP